MKALTLTLISLSLYRVGQSQSMQNSVYLNVPALYFNAISLNYEKLKLDKHLNFRFNALVSLYNFQPSDPRVKAGTFDYDPLNTIWNVGFNVNVFIAKHRTLDYKPKLTIGPVIEFGTFYYGYVITTNLGKSNNSYWATNNYQYTQINEIGQKTTALIRVAFGNAPNNRFFVTIAASIGRIFFNEEYKHHDYPNSSWFFTPPAQKHFEDKWTLKVEGNIGFRF